MSKIVAEKKSNDCQEGCRFPATDRVICLQDINKYRQEGAEMYKCRFCGCELTEENWYKADQKNRQYRCQECQNTQNKKHDRKHKLTTKNGKGENIYLRGLNKRPFPDGRICEMCGEPVNKMDYHHWDDKNPSKGIWLCYFCHKHAHAWDSGLIKKYLLLRLELDSLNNKEGKGEFEK